jgi:hypothetical protein
MGEMDQLPATAPVVANRAHEIAESAQIADEATLRICAISGHCPFRAIA